MIARVRLLDHRGGSGVVLVVLVLVLHELVMLVVVAWWQDDWRDWPVVRWRRRRFDLYRAVKHQMMHLPRAVRTKPNLDSTSRWAHEQEWI
mmetsp:Transcript_47128/g.96341  ORF Transcript_47128/g.96341 Transcript_47128/m.96341 type:complete len:91 (-) Transcript_47128:67-339(-)